MAAQGSLAGLDDVSAWPELSTFGQAALQPQQHSATQQERHERAEGAADLTLPSPVGLSQSPGNSEPVSARIPFQERVSEQNVLEAGKENTQELRPKSVGILQDDFDTELAMCKAMLDNAARQLMMRDEQLSAYQKRDNEHTNIIHALVAALEHNKAEAESQWRERDTLVKKQLTDLQADIIQHKSRRAEAETKAMQLLTQLREQSESSRDKAKELLVLGKQLQEREAGLHQLTQELSRACHVIEGLSRERDGLKAQLMFCLCTLKDRQAADSCLSEPPSRESQHAAEEPECGLKVKGRPTSGTTDTCAKAGSECAAGPLQALQLSEAAATGNAPQDSDTAGAAEELGGALVSAESGEAEQPGNLASAGSTASGMLGTGVFLPQAAGQSTTERLSLGAGLPISELMSTLNSLRVAAPSTEEADGRTDSDADQPEARRQKHFRGKRGSGINRKLWRALGLDLSEQPCQDPSVQQQFARMQVIGAPPFVNNGSQWGTMLPPQQQQPPPSAFVVSQPGLAGAPFLPPVPPNPWPFQ